MKEKGYSEARNIKYPRSVWRGNGQTIPNMICLFQDREIHKVKIDQDGVYKVTEGGEIVHLPKEDEEVTKLESVFYRPVGSKLPVTFQNVDANNIHVIIGGKLSFEAIELNTEEQKTIQVKADHRAHHSFGVATAHFLNDGEREFTATMFDISPGGRRIKISRTSLGFTASLLKADDVETPLPAKETKLFRDSDRQANSILLSWLFGGISTMVGGVRISL